ncbi:hypothetical protein CR513_43570, partial [Mucuna pruriens]
SKLQPRGDGPFQVLEKINDNAYKIDLPGEYNISASFNVSDLTLFDADDDAFDLRANPLQEGGSDEDMTKSVALEGLGGPMTRARIKRVKEAIQQVLAVLIRKELNLEGCKPNVGTNLGQISQGHNHAMPNLDE